MVRSTDWGVTSLSRVTNLQLYQTSHDPYLLIISLLKIVYRVMPIALAHFQALLMDKGTFVDTAF